MTGPRTLIAGLIGVVVAVAVVALLLPGGETEGPVIGEPVAGTTETTTPVTVAPSLAAVEVDDPVTDGCTPDPGIEVSATGPIEDYPPGEEVDERVVVGSTARVDFRIDAPGNRNLIIFRLAYVEANEVHGWTEVAWYQDSELTFDQASQRLIGGFRLSHTVGATDAGSENPEPTEVDLVYDRARSRLSGPVDHPETSFMLDLAPVERPREFFVNPTCYPAPEENFALTPVDEE